jgi:hypothetical protein
VRFDAIGIDPVRKLNGAGKSTTPPLPPVVRFSPIGGWPAGTVQGEGVVVCLDFEVVFVDAGQLSYNRDTILAAINVDSREKTRSRQLARRRKGTQDAIHFVLQSAQLAKRIGGSKKAEGKQSGHRSFLPQGPMAVPFSAWARAHIGIIGRRIQRPERLDFRAEGKASAEGADRRIETYPKREASEI